ncbi:MAG: ABC transporter ATP-binding protein [Chloroflexota bacterium]
MGRLRSSLDNEDDGNAKGKVYDARMMRRVPEYLAGVKVRMILGGVGTLIHTIASLAMPYLVAVAIDRFIKTGNFSGLNVIALAYVVTALIMWGGHYMETLNLSCAAQGILFSLRTRMFNHLHDLSLSFFDHNKVGKVMSRIQNDVEQMETLLTQDIISLITNALTLIAIAAVMITMNARLAMLALTVVPALGALLFVWQKYARRAFMKVRMAIATVNDQLQEGISGVRVTQSLSREAVNLRQFEAVNREHLNANVEAARLQAFMTPTVEILTNSAFALVLVFGGAQVLAGEIGVGVLLAFMLYIQRFFAPVQELIMLYTELQRAMASGTRIFELLDVAPEIKDSLPPTPMPRIKGEIKFQHVSFGYEPGADVLHDIDLTVNPGETVAIVGPTGAGKSSLTSLVSRFYDVSHGAVLIDGQNVASVTQRSLRRQIGIVPQDPFLFSSTVGDNIRYGRPEASREEVAQAAQAAGAHDFITRLEHGYDTPVGERGGNLSAGQRQLVCLARAILTDPRILILDEATSSVDTNTERIMQTSLRHLAQGRTCLIIAHRLSTVTDADRIVVIEHGKIIETGSHRELMAKQGLYYQMVETLNAPGG